MTVKERGQVDKDRFYRARENDPENLDAIIDAKEDDYQWVFGNPPYVRSHNQNDRVTEEYKSLHDTFGEEQSDIFLAFVEQALEWLDDGGRMAFVISNKLLVTESSEDAMQYMLDNATIDLIGDLTRCKIFGFDVNVFPVLVVLTKRSGEDNEDVRKNNETEVVKVFTKGSRETNEWEHSLDHAAAELIPWRDAPDYDFETDFESEEYPSITTEDTYERYQVPQSRFTDDWGSWNDRLALNFQIDETLWSAVKEMEDTDTRIPLREVCEIDEDGTPWGSPGRGIEPNKYREYTVDDPSETPVVSGASIESFYLGDTQADVDEYIDVSAVQADGDSSVSDNKLDAFLNEPKLAYSQTSPELGFAVDDPSETTRFYNLTGYFLQMRDVDGTFGEYTDAADAIDLYYVAGLLNSEVLDFYYKAYYEHLAFRHAPAMRNLPSYLHHLPIHVPSDEEKERIKALSTRLHEAKRELKQANHGVETLLETFSRRGDTVPFRTKVSSIVDTHENYSIGSFNIDQDGTTVHLNRYHTVEMHSEAQAEDLAEFLKDFGGEYIAGDSLRELELPEDFDEFREEHNGFSTRREELSEEIEETLEELNDEVYELYGVTEYRDEIQEYLESFLTVIK